MKIAFFGMPDHERKVVEDTLSSNDLLFLDGDLEPSLEKIKDVDVLSIFICHTITKEVIEKLPNLKLISTRSAGYDHIDLEAAKERNISVVNVSDYGIVPVAEFTFALIMDLSRKAYASYSRLRMTGDTDLNFFEGFDLSGKTIGIVGTGNIGKHVARIAKGFGMKILLSDLNQDENFAKEIGGEYKNLDELVSQSDIVSLHVPYNKHTHHLIDADLFEKFKEGSYLINTARGGVVDTAALIKALKSGKLKGAGLDVVEGEEDFREETTCLIEDKNDAANFKQIIEAHELVDMENVIVTPHIAFDTKEAKEEILRTTIENITAFTEGNLKNNLAQ